MCDKGRNLMEPIVRYTSEILSRRACRSSTYVTRLWDEKRQNPKSRHNSPLAVGFELKRPPPPSQKKKKKKTNWETTGVGQGCGKDAHGQDGLTGVKLGVPGIRLRVDQRKGSKGCQREALGLGI